jgi:hypothetical protein
MGATGIRGLRVAHECGIPVTINDREPEAIGADHQNNAIPANFPLDRGAGCQCPALRTLLRCRGPRPVRDPGPFVDAAVRGTRRFLFVTATDTAPLCGAHLKAGIRRYGAVPMNTEYHSEVGLRILLGFVVRETVKYDRGIEPLFCYAREHFTRLHLRLLRGAPGMLPMIPYREKRMGFIRTSAHEMPVSARNSCTGSLAGNSEQKKIWSGCWKPDDREQVAHRSVLWVMTDTLAGMFDGSSPDPGSTGTSGQIPGGACCRHPRPYSFPDDQRLFEICFFTMGFQVHPDEPEAVVDGILEFFKYESPRLPRS